jgi:cellulose synthase operon protein YhjQ
MDQGIAVEWGRFLREIEGHDQDGLKKNSDQSNSGSGATGQSSPTFDSPKNAFSQRLEDALAMPAAPEAPLLPESQLVPGEQAVRDGQQEQAEPGHASLEPFTRNSAVNITRTTWLKTSPADSSSVLEPKREAADEMGTFSMQTQCNGAGQEALEIAAAPSPQNSPAPEPQLTTMHENAAVQKTSSTPMNNPEGEMWKSVTRTYAAASEEPALNSDAAQAAHGQETSRWFVLKGVLGGAATPEKTAEETPAGNIPVLEIFSLAGGAGKTSLAATLGRALSARGERVLLVEATPLASLQYFFGACDSRPGTVRTFRPPASSSDAPIRLATVEPEVLMMESTAPGSLAAEVQRWSKGASRVIVDVATGSTSTARGLARMSPVILVPLIPDIQAVVTASSIDAFFQRNGTVSGASSEVYYFLNQFDPALPLHLDVRKILREKLGERMLPFALPRTPAVSEALAEGMTIMDYAPDSPATEEFLSLAKWLEDALAPADMNLRGMRWSER